MGALRFDGGVQQTRHTGSVRVEGEKEREMDVMRGSRVAMMRGNYLGSVRGREEKSRGEKDERLRR